MRWLTRKFRRVRPEGHYTYTVGPREVLSVMSRGGATRPLSRLEYALVSDALLLLRSRLSVDQRSQADDLLRMLGVDSATPYDGNRRQR